MNWGNLSPFFAPSPSVSSGTDPYKYLVVDNFLEDAGAKELARDFPDASAPWHRYDNPFERKLLQDDMRVMPVPHMLTFLILNSGPFVEFLERSMGISGLIPDPSLRGGGLHQIMTGGKLDIHCDFNWHQHLKLDRRLNAILYLNPIWDESWGGHLEMWDRNMTACQKKIAPVFNRLVVFETTDFSYHGHPEPLRCPPSVTRKSMAWYYYTNGRPESEKSAAHAAMFKKRPDEETSEEIEELRRRRNLGSKHIA